jgi:TPR repeat protein
MGIGNPQSAMEAVRWYQQAANAGVPGANFAMGRLYESGGAVIRNGELAISFYRRAAEGGHQEAKRALDRLLEAQSA